MAYRCAEMLPLRVGLDAEEQPPIGGVPVQPRQGVDPELFTVERRRCFGVLELCETLTVHVAARSQHGGLEILATSRAALREEAHRHRRGDAERGTGIGI